jgi:hypothetical protein
MCESNCFIWLRSQLQNNFIGKSVDLSLLRRSFNWAIRNMFVWHVLAVVGFGLKHALVTCASPTFLAKMSF